jgi:hypothetical protein
MLNKVFKQLNMTQTLAVAVCQFAFVITCSIALFFGTLVTSSRKCIIAFGIWTLYLASIAQIFSAIKAIAFTIVVRALATTTLYCKIILARIKLARTYLDVIYGEKFYFYFS